MASRRPPASSNRSTTTSALDALVARHVRASLAGQAQPLTDDQVASALVRSADELDTRYRESGISAHLSREGKLLKPNASFLAKVVKSTEDHNRELLRQQREDAEAKLRQLDGARSDHDHSGRRDGSRDRKRRRDDSRDRSSRERDRDRDSRRRRSPSLDKQRRQRRSDSPPPSSARPTISSLDDFSQTDTYRPQTAHSRGRGPVGSSRLEKVFDKGYDPRLDPDNYDDGNLEFFVRALEDKEVEINLKRAEKEAKREERKKKKKKSSSERKEEKKDRKSKKTKKRRSSSSESESSSSSDSDSDDERRRKRKEKDRKRDRSRSPRRRRSRSRSRSPRREKERGRERPQREAVEEDVLERVAKRPDKSSLPEACPW